MPQASKFLQGEGIQSTAKGDQSFQIRSDAFPKVAPVKRQQESLQATSYFKSQAYSHANPLKGYEFQIPQGGLKPTTNAQLSIAPGQALPLGTIRTVGGSNKNK